VDKFILPNIVFVNVLCVVTFLLKYDYAKEDYLVRRDFDQIAS
jgi:hypothetical protein